MPGPGSVGLRNADFMGLEPGVDPDRGHPRAGRSTRSVVLVLVMEFDPGRMALTRAGAGKRTGDEPAPDCGASWTGPASPREADRSLPEGKREARDGRSSPDGQDQRPRDATSLT
jgi:hypothetical protein